MRKEKEKRDGYNALICSGEHDWVYWGGGVGYSARHAECQNCGRQKEFPLSNAGIEWFAKNQGNCPGKKEEKEKEKE